MVSGDSGKPVLAVDVDGVISLFGFDGPLDEVPGNFHLIDGVAHCIADGVGPRLLRLADHFEMIWATGWEERANDHLPHLLGLADDLPALTFGGRARFGTAHWKLDALDEFAAGRPLAWIDDSLDESCHAWASERSRSDPAGADRVRGRPHRRPRRRDPRLGARARRGDVARERRAH